jgi:hypothetical protein
MNLLRFLAVALILVTAAPAARAVDFTMPAHDEPTPDEIRNMPPFYVNESDVEWWDEAVDGFRYRLFLMLDEQRGEDLYELSADHVGEDIAIYYNGHYLSTMKVMDVIVDDTIPLILDAETRDRLVPALPEMKDGAPKPKLRVMKLP